MKQLVNKSVLSTVVIVAAISVSGCSTIVFDNVPVAQSPDAEWKKSHHQIGGIFELFEFQQPKNLESICEGKVWEHIATQQTFLDGLINFLVPYGIYSPKTTFTKCAEPVDLVLVK